MRLNITHKTTYRYEDPPIFSAEVIRLTPRTNISQHLVRWRIEPSAGLSAWSDAFGNVSHMLVVDEPRNRIDIIASGEVVTSETNGVLPRDEGELPLEVFLAEYDTDNAQRRNSGFLPMALPNVFQKMRWMACTS